MPREDRSKHKRIDPKSESAKYLAAKKRQRRQGDITKLPAGLRQDTTTSAYGDAGRGRPVPGFLNSTFKKPKPNLQNRKRKLPPKEDNYGQFSKGGEVCRGAGAAIKGTKFEGVF